jgi:PKD domain/Bacterial Ig-like domain (group 1)
MIAPFDTSVRRAPSPKGPGRFTSVLWAIACLVVALGAAACDKIALTAPSNSSITLFSNLTTVNLGGSAQITATVIEGGGTPVHDGTEVTFTTTIGTVDPVTVQTDDGKATVTLRPGNQSGTAVVRAFSGGTQSGDLEIIIGAAAVSRVILTANPSSVSATRGGTVTLSAFVIDEGNNPVPNVRVNFTTTAGTITMPSVTTDANGEARTVLTTSRETRVRASVGATDSNELTITANNAPTISITVSPTSVAENVPVTFTYNVTADNNVALREVFIDFGDGETRSLGTARTGTVTKTYRRSGTFPVEIEVTDANGERGTSSTAVVVTPALPLLGTVAVQPNPARVNAVTTVTVTLSNSTLTPLVTGVTYDFGDGSDPQNGGLTGMTHVYTRVGTFPLRATVRLNDGRTTVAGPIDVVVLPAQ